MFITNQPLVTVVQLVLGLVTVHCSLDDEFAKIAAFPRYLVSGHNASLQTTPEHSVCLLSTCVWGRIMDNTFTPNIRIYICFPHFSLQIAATNCAHCSLPECKVCLAMGRRVSSDCQHRPLSL